jgi:hypothetical protein
VIGSWQTARWCSQSREHPSPIGGPTCRVGITKQGSHGPRRLANPAHHPDLRRGALFRSIDRRVCPSPSQRLVDLGGQPGNGLDGDRLGRRVGVVTDEPWRVCSSGCAYPSGRSIRSSDRPADHGIRPTDGRADLRRSVGGAAVGDGRWPPRPEHASPRWRPHLVAPRMGVADRLPRAGQAVPAPVSTSIARRPVDAQRAAAVASCMVATH